MRRFIIFDLISVGLGVPIYLIAAFAIGLQPAASSYAGVLLAIGLSGAAVAILGVLVSAPLPPKKEWWSALVASIGASVCFPFLGVPSVIILLLDKESLTKEKEQSESDAKSRLSDDYDLHTQV